MKRKYVKPVFCAEEYVFNASIAKCDIDVDTTSPLEVIRNETVLCVSGGSPDNGHKFGDKGIVGKNDSSQVITIFNDGVGNDGCKYDWDGRTNIVAQTGENFAQSFFGNNASPSQHTPGYNGSVFMS